MSLDSVDSGLMKYDERTALIVTDVQNDFADPRGSLYVRGGEHVVERVNGEIAAAREAGALVLYTQDWHPPATPHFEKDGGIWPVHCVAGSWGAELHPLLVVDGETLRKGTGGEDGYSGFTVADPVTGERSSTGAAELLRRHGVERVVIVGLATDYCVKETALDAVAEGFGTAVLRDGVRPVDVRPGDGERALDELVEAGVVVA
jgi:nicotinamidase/pyrazinamidase